MCKNKQKNRHKNNSFIKKFDSDFDDIFKDPRYFIQKAKKEKKQIFTIIKVGKRGRRKKVNIVAKYTYYNNHRQHNKLSYDNIIRKLKRYFTNSLLDFVNKLYEMEKSQLESDTNNNSKNKAKKPDKWLQIIQNKNIIQIKKNENLMWFDCKIKDYLSSDVSEKCKNYDKNYNKIQIQKICQENTMKNLSKFLQDINIRFLFEIYAKDYDFGIGIKGWYLKFLTLKNDVDQMTNEERTDDEEGRIDREKYTSKIREVAINLENIFKKKRKRRKNDIIIEI